MAITMTDFASEKIYDLMKRTQCEDSYLRIALKGGGCSGLSYIFDLTKDAEENDKVFSFGNVKICIDRKSYLFLNGINIDYEESPFKSGIKLVNPQAVRTCGCGESFSV